MSTRWFRVEQEDQFENSVNNFILGKAKGLFRNRMMPFYKIRPERTRNGARYEKVTDCLVYVCTKGTMRVLNVFHFSVGNVMNML